MIESLIFSTGFLSALICQQITIIWIYVVAHPILYSDFNFITDFFMAKSLIAVMVTNFGVLLIYYSILFIMNELIAENRNKSEEYQQLLNWIKSGLILQQETEKEGFDIRFSNSMAMKIFNKLFLYQKEVTEQDTKEQIFEKVTFEDQPDQENSRHGTR